MSAILRQCLVASRLMLVRVDGDVDWMDSVHAIQAKQHHVPRTVPVSVYHIQQAGHHLYLDNPDDFNSVTADVILDRRPAAALEHKSATAVSATNRAMAKQRETTEAVILQESFESVEGVEMGEAESEPIGLDADMTLESPNVLSDPNAPSNNK